MILQSEIVNRTFNCLYRVSIFSHLINLYKHFISSQHYSESMHCSFFNYFLKFYLILYRLASSENAAMNIFVQKFPCIQKAKLIRASYYIPCIIYIHYIIYLENFKIKLLCKISLMKIFKHGVTELNFFNDLL